MGDDWDADDWDTKEIQLPLKPVDSKTNGEPNMAQFADEDASEPEPESSTSTAKPPKKKEVPKAPVVPVDTPLDDPVAEKARQQRLIEQADFAATADLFGKQLNLDNFLPKTLKDFEELAAELVNRYVIVHNGSKYYKPFIKALIKGACEPLPSSETKDVETSLAGFRADKVKAEAVAAAAKKNLGKKASLNMGKQGPGPDLDDYEMYGGGTKSAAVDDDYDFM